MARKLARALPILLALIGCQSSHPPLPVVEGVDLDRYVGRWYEIASFPQRFQKGCVASTAHYTRIGDTRLQVVNECRDQTLEGELRRAEGVAWLSDPAESTAKLKVQFFWPFRADYWIVQLGPDYDYAVVGHPSRNYLWILSRTPQMDGAVYASIVEQLEATHFDVSRLALTLQPTAAPPPSAVGR